MGVATGCGFKKIYRFPHTTYPYSSCICTFLQQTHTCFHTIHTYIHTHASTLYINTHASILYIHTHASILYTHTCFHIIYTHTCFHTTHMLPYYTYTHMLPYYTYTHMLPYYKYIHTHRRAIMCISISPYNPIMIEMQLITRPIACCSAEQMLHYIVSVISKSRLLRQITANESLFES